MMHHFYEWLLKPYHDYETHMIYLEIIAASTGVISVYLCNKRNIFTYVFGVISAFIYIYMLYKWELFGDMLLNCYFFVVNIVGLFIWRNHLEKGGHVKVYIKRADRKQKKMALHIFLITLIITPFIYALQKGVAVTNLPIYAFVDAFVTGVAFSALYLEVQRSIESWYLWAIGNVVSIPLFIYKGYGITALQYCIFLILVWFGWKSWKEKLITQT